MQVLLLCVILGRVDESEPEAGSSQLDEGEIACGGLVVAGGDGAELLQLVVQPLDPIPQAVELAVERQRRRAGRVGRDHRQDAAEQQVLPDPVGIVAHVADQAARARCHVLDQGLKCTALVRLSGREDDGEWQPIRVAAQVQLGREAAAGAAQRLSVLPPLAPAACWWARTTVASSICSRSSAAPLPARAANTASNRPRSQLWSMLVYGSGGSLLLGSLNGFAVAEAHAIDHLSEALRAVQPTPVPLGRLGKHEDHCKGGLA